MQRRTMFKVFLVFSTVAFLSIGCKAIVPRQPAGDLAATAAEACSEEQLELLIERLGIIAALSADESACLDSPGIDIAEPKNVDATSSGIASLPADDFGLTESAKYRTRLQVLIGWQVIYDLLNNVAHDAVHGTQRGGHSAADIARLREQVKGGFDGVRPIIGMLDSSAHSDIIYSYPDLYAIVKSSFVDPLVYGYNGPLHRIVHRRYARGRGIVYRVATQKLAEALGQFHRVAQTELAAFSDKTLGIRLIRYEGSLRTADENFMTLYFNEAVLGSPVSWRQTKTLAELAQREVQRLREHAQGQ